MDLMQSGDFGLLSNEQVFGNEENGEGIIDVIRKTGAKCAATDLAILSGCAISGETHLEMDSSLRGRTGRWFLRSAGGYGDVCAVNGEGTRVLTYANAPGSLRPVLPCSDIFEMGARRDISGFLEVELGEYPQYAVDRSMAGRLEADYAKGRLRRTGKAYRSMPEDAECREYVFENGKYVRVHYKARTWNLLSDGRKYAAGDFVWLKVEPVKWLYDEAAGLLVSRRILVSGVRFCDNSFYDGEFGSTRIHQYMNASLCADMIPSEVEEMNAEEKAVWEADLARAEKRRNPYDLTFGQVSEEDIIRGAIESDIPVFLHGPSSEGKSARVKQIDPTCEIIYLRNATPDSLNGRSVYNQATGEMIDIPPTWYKKVVAKCEQEPDTFHVVFFDEINNALPSIQGMAFNIVLDREVNALWKLPDNARVVAAGNDMQDSLAANQIAAPFFNRFAHVYINTTTSKWLKWARENRIHPAIYSFIAYRRGETLRSEYDGEKPNADPRKWEMASKMLYATGRPEMLRALIGEEITDEFVQFCNLPVITLEDVLAGNYTEKEIEEMNTAERYATTMGLTQADDAQVEIVRAFVARLGEEFLNIFDSLREQKLAMAQMDGQGEEQSGDGPESEEEDGENLEKVELEGVGVSLDENAKEVGAKLDGEAGDEDAETEPGEGADAESGEDADAEPGEGADAEPDGNSDQAERLIDLDVDNLLWEEAERERREEGTDDDLRDLIPEKISGDGNDISPDARPLEWIGTAPPVIDWRLVLRDTINYGVDWSFTNATVEDGIVRPALEEQPMPETEIVLDTSWSVQEDLLRNFLRECKNILPLSKVRAGCFDTVFYGFQDIQSEEDIENMVLEGGGGTDFDTAVDAFTMRVDNRIVFTDGKANMPEKRLNVIWMVYGDEDIEPPGGTVIHISSEQLEQLRRRR